MAVSQASHTTHSRAGDYDCLRFTFADVNGIARGRTVMKGKYSKYLQDGVELWSGVPLLGPKSEIILELPGIKGSTLGNASVLPASDHINDVPWAGGDYRVGEILCETVLNTTGEYMGASTRTIARRQVQRLEDLGFVLYSAPELEFTFTKIDDQTRPVFEDHQFASTQTLALYEDFMLKLNDQVKKAGIEMDMVNTEYAQGQMEITLDPRLGIHSADATFRFKEALKEICQREKFAQVTYMTKPFAGELCNGMHLNHSLRHKGSRKSAMFDPADVDNLSSVARHWIAGLVRHGPGITALCMPTFNCYRRLQIPWVPSKSNWGIDNRLCTFRVKNRGADGTYVENRLPTSPCNPYLMLAASVAAGIDGVVNKLELPEQADNEAQPIPKTLEDALNTLENDSVICEAMGKEFIDTFLMMKRKSEVEKFKDHALDEANTKPEDLASERAEYFKFI